MLFTRAARLTRPLLILLAGVLATAGLFIAGSHAGSASAATVRTAHPSVVADASGTKPTIVLVHGAWADSGSWNAVTLLLQQAGYTVYAPPNPLQGLVTDTASITDFLHSITGPVVLVGHSYGGAVITEAGLDDNVAALVYIAAFAPDKGESVNTLIAGFPADGPQPPILPPREGFLFLDRDKFHGSFAGDLPAEQAAFMADSQLPWGVNALGGTISEASWRIKPSWYLLTTEDRMIPPSAQRAMAERTGATVTEVPASHSVYVSQPKAVASLIEQAAG
jgi:pimeloyl-ACP methyl ester carboxylesterase